MAVKCVASKCCGDFNLRVSEPGPIPAEQDLALEGAAQEDLRERAVVEVSNFCRENCAYCGMRRDNRALARFRSRHDRLAELLIHHRPASVTDVNIQAGEDPVAVREVVLPLIETLRRETPLGISVCLGTLSPGLYCELKAAGASIYIMKFECADAGQYKRFEAPGTLDERLEHIRLLAASGWNVSSGFIAGLPGQEPRDLWGNLRLAKTLPLRGCSVSPFIPGEATPLSDRPPSDPNWTFNCIALMRLLRPDWVIPAISALNLARENGYRHGLRAGANLVTINMTPDDVRADYVIYKRDRVIMTEARVLDALAAEGLAPSPCGLADYYRKSSASPSRMSVVPA